MSSPQEKQPMDNKPVPVPDEINLNEPPINSGATRRPMGSNMGMTILISLICALVVTYIMAGMMNVGKFVTQKDFTTNTSGFATKDQIVGWDTQFRTLKDADTDLQNKYNNLNGSVSGMQGNLENYINQALNSKTTDINNQIDELLSAVTILDDRVKAITVPSDVAYKSDVNTINTDIATIKTQIADIQAKLPTPTPTPTTSGSTTTLDKLSFMIKDLGTEILEGTSGFDSEESIRLTITNNNTSEVTGLRLYLYLIPDIGLNPKLIDIVNGNMRLSGDLTCTLKSSNSDEYKFQTSKINIKAGQTRTFLLTPNIVLLQKAYYKYIDANDGYTNEANAPNKVNTPNSDADRNLSNDTSNPWYLTNDGIPTVFQYTDANGILTNSQTGRTKVNASYINNDITFSETFDVVDYIFN